MTTGSAPQREYTIEEFVLHSEPYYLPLSDEVELFEAAYQQQLPVLLKGPTGCGKTRFIEHMAWRLGRPLTVIKGTEAGASDGTSVPLVTIACHEDLTASDLVGRYLLEPEGTRWMDGPLTRAVKAGAICYLDEVVEAWTRRREAAALTLSLQGAGVSAYPAASGEMLLNDAHVRARGAWQEVEHPKMGQRAVQGLAWRSTPDGTPEARPSPLLGEHNGYILGGVLGLSSGAIDALTEAGAFE